jgi:bifunctional oligoribonuclease and PAP phosphatase NrnA
MLLKSDIKKVEEFKSILNSAKSIVLTTHHNPDGDAVGSVLGLYHALKAYGYPVLAVTPNGFPDFLSWMPGSSEVIKYSEQKSVAVNSILNADAIICLDFNGFKRTEEMGDVLMQSKGKKVLVDHHPVPENQFDLQFSYTEVSSTCELVYEILSNTFGNDICITDSAICLFVGIMTDTGSFSYACSRGRTFQIAGELISKGVDVERVQGLVYNNFSTDRMRLLGYSLNEKMKVFLEHKSAYISLTKEDLKKFKHTMGDTEGFVNLPLSIKGVIFSVLFVEHDSFVKVSLRSRGSFPANMISQKHFNGGGHTNAAGGKAFMSLSETEKYFENILKQYSILLNKS